MKKLLLTLLLASPCLALESPEIHAKKYKKLCIKAFNKGNYQKAEKVCLEASAYDLNCKQCLTMVNISAQKKQERLKK